MNALVSGIVPTFERPDSCERAVRSMLAQDPALLEVLVCDDGSNDDTERRFTDWQARDDRVRYLRVPRNTGTPAAARNLGARAARGEWLAFLDDDDAWLPGKLAAQLDVAEAHDVIGTNATLTDGAPYLAELPAVRRCTRRDVLAANPLICSTVIARRALVLDAGGFPEARWLSGIEDYALWLEMADRGARIAVLAAPLAVYTSDPADRLSTGRHIASALARLALTRAVRRPLDLRLWRTAGNYGLAMLRPQNAGR